MFRRKGFTESRTALRLDSMVAQLEQVATQLAELRAERSTLELETRIDALSREKERLLSELADVANAKARQELDIEHKLGLHREQIESEKRIMLAEAEAERLRAVEQAKLAVREENLTAERERFEQEIEFRTQRFEAEAETLRNLTSQILERLPNVTASFTHHVGETKPQPPALGSGDE